MSFGQKKEEYAKEIVEQYDILSECDLNTAVHEYVDILVPIHRDKIVEAFHDIEGQPHILMINATDVISEGYHSIEGFCQRAIFDEWFGELYPIVQELVFGDEEE